MVGIRNEFLYIRPMIFFIKNKTLHYFIVYSLFVGMMILNACNNHSSIDYLSQNEPVTLPIHGMVIPTDSIKPPTVIPVDEKKLKKVTPGKPTIVALNNNMHIAGKPTKTKVGNPKTNRIGVAPFLKPQQTSAAYKKVKCKMPKPVKASLPVIKDNANINIQYLDVEQGLNSSYISCLYENTNPLQQGIWFGSDGGGVGRFDGEHFTHFDIESGLSSQSVTCILQDKHNALWFGTFGGGIVHFDGDSFSIFTQESDLGDNTILCMLTDHAGNIWFGRDGGGVSKYNASNGKTGNETFTVYTQNHGLASNVVNCMFQDKDKQLWFGGDDGICKFDGESFMVYNKSQGFKGESVSSIVQDAQGVMWFGTDVGLIKYDGHYFETYTEKEGLSNETISALILDREANLWIGTSGGGINKFDGISFTHYTEKEGLSNNKVNDIVQLQNGNLWIATFGGGINKFDISKGGFTHFQESSGLSHSMVSSILQDKKGDFWFGTFGKGINKFDTATQTFTQYTEKQGLCSNIVKQMIQDQKGDYWFGTDGGGVTRYEVNKNLFTHFKAEDGLGDNTVWHIYEDRKGNIWFGTFAGVAKYDGNCFTQYNEGSGLSSNTVMCTKEDRHGNLWFGTYKGGLTKFEPAINRFTHYSTKTGFCNNTILNILEDVKGNLWMGTDGSGVCKYEATGVNGGEEKMTVYNTNIGLSSDIVWSILEDTTHGTDAENFWLGTEKGLTYFSLPRRQTNDTNLTQHLQKPTCMVFTKKEGLLANDFILNAACIDQQGYAWWGTGKGLTHFDIQHYKTSGQIPVIQLNDIQINETFIDYRHLSDTSAIRLRLPSIDQIQFNNVTPFNNYPENLHLPYDLNHLSFYFSALDLSGQAHMQYQFRIQGLDDKWSERSTQNKADYRNIPYGKYVFQVKAMSSAGKWSQTVSYPFKIHPPWWKSTLAKIAYSIMAVLLMFGIVQWNSRRLRNRAKELEEEVDKATLVIKAEKKKSDDLLLNILPEEVAEELKKTGEAEAKQFNEVTVLFTDFVGFTSISEQMSATDLVAEIHKNFTAFDAIIETYGLEKIKTIGDAYMAVCGLPHATADHATRVVAAALAIRDYIASSDGKFQIRIGVNTGSVVAGIVGVKKYAYDIWGDTVNTASRIESAGMAGKVNISGSTYEKVKELFTCEYRGKISVKGKGEVDMYFVG